MAQTKTSLCNLALSMIGDTRNQLTNVDTDNTVISRQCLLHYEQTLHELVRMHSWNCAKGRADLTTTDATAPAMGWSKETTLPTGCIRPLFLASDASMSQFWKPEVDWSIEGRTLYSNHTNNYLIYEAEPVPATMDALFARAFYTLLASKLAKPIAGDDQLAINLTNQFESVILPEARRVNGFEGSEPPIVDSEWLDATYGSSNYAFRPFGASSYGSL